MIFGVEPVSIAKWAATGATTGGGFAALFYGVRWLIEYFAGRMDKKADRLDADIRFVIDQLRAELKRVHEEHEEDRRRLDEAFRRLDKCQEQHAEAKAEVMQLRAMIQGYGNARDMVQTDIAAGRALSRKVAK